MDKHKNQQTDQDKIAQQNDDNHKLTPTFLVAAQI